MPRTSCFATGLHRSIGILKVPSDSGWHQDCESIEIDWRFLFPGISRLQRARRILAEPGDIEGFHARHSSHSGH